MNFIKLFNLKIIKINRGCNFELSWEEGLTISATLDYPDSLETSYADWRQAYLHCYENLRAKIVRKGKVQAPLPDSQAKLREAEAHFLSEFHRWLRNEQLYEIRETITNAARNITNPNNHWVDVLLTCHTLELARLPWEAWEINTKLSAPGTRTIRLARIPNRIRSKTISPIRRKARVLAILGDDKGLNFEDDKQALRMFSNVAEVEFTGWQPGKDIAQLKQEIAEKICDRKGWDILFFAGHSNENINTGGQLSIAPQVSIGIKDIAKPLEKARDRGLQFAIFNSCSGISIAESLIDLGLPQVAVMREPIHNQVAQEFLVQFLNSLAKYKDVHESLLDACAFLKEQKNLTYPSTYLIPSLFRHPQSQLFNLEPFGIWYSIKKWLPSKKEGVYLTAFLTLSLISPIQDLLLEPRLLLQSSYRQFTQGTKNITPAPNQKSPILLVQIDRKSLKRDKVQLVDERYMNYSYLSRIVDKLVENDAQLIGVDYILDRDKKQPENSQQFKQSIDKAVNQGTWFVWGANEIEEEGISPDIANLNQSMAGDITLYDWYMELPENNCQKTCPFAYLLSLSHRLLNQDISPDNLLQPQFSETNFRNQVFSPTNIKDKDIDLFPEFQFPAVNNFFWWFQPIIDYSIPPRQAYETISACELLGSCTPTPAIAKKNLKSKIVIIAPGGYKQAGVDKEGEDNAIVPIPIAFWRGKQGWDDFLDGKKSFTGGEAHAYTVHHFLNRHLVVPIPNFFMVLLAAVLGTFIGKVLQNHPHRVGWGWIGFGTGTVVYVVVSLQVYISSAVLVPIVFPLIVLGNYLRLGLKCSQN